MPRRDRLRVVAQVDGVAADVTDGDLEVLEMGVAEIEDAEPHRSRRSDIDMPGFYPGCRALLTMPGAHA